MVSLDIRSFKLSSTESGRGVATALARGRLKSGRRLEASYIVVSTHCTDCRQYARLMRRKLTGSTRSTLRESRGSKSSCENKINNGETSRQTIKRTYEVLLQEGHHGRQNLGAGHLGILGHLGIRQNRQEQVLPHRQQGLQVQLANLVRRAC
jgi:hypothetical protein